MRPDAPPSLPPPHAKIGLVHVKHLKAMTAALWCDKAFAHRHFHLVLDFAQDEDLAANIRYRMGRVHLHHGGPAEARG